jgi:hypothetical protein
MTRPTPNAPRLPAEPAVSARDLSFCRTRGGTSTLSPCGFQLADFLRRSSFGIRHSCLLLALLACPAFADSVDVEGAALAQELVSQRPESGTTNVGTLRIRLRGQPPRVLPLRVIVEPGSPDWQGRYEVGAGTNLHLLIIHHGTAATRGYTLAEPGPGGPHTNRPNGNATMVRFAGSDFWVADLGLEFLHWPGQRIVGREMRRSRGCLVLESTNPHPAPGAYARVRSWIDHENRGIVIAEAYDANNKLLKEFTPNDFTKVEGRWELEEMELRNVQEGSQSIIKFDLGTPATTPAK